MKEAEFSTHTVKSHGFKVARMHFHDWVLVLLLMVIYVSVYSINPFYRFVGKDMMTDLKYPMKSITVPSWAVPIYAVVLPIIIFLAFYFRRRDVYDLHHGTLGLLVSVLITGIVTEAIKNAVGRPRPDFFWRCFPDGKDVYDQLGNVVCHGEDSIIRDGHKSFPSGHASCLALVTICYLQFFPPPYHTDGSGPYAYFQVLEELRNAAQPTNSNVQIGQQQSEQSNHENMGDSQALDCSLIEIESGRRIQSERVPLLLNTSN